MRRTTTLLACGALALGAAACGDDGDEPVEGTTTPATVATTTRTIPNPITLQIEALRECLGGTPVTRVDVFEPTYEYARANGGGGFAVKVGKVQMEFLVLPTTEAAETTAADVTSQLTQLQAGDPEAYAAVAATATQTFGSIVQIVPTGTTSPKLNTKVATCANEAQAAG
jgi:hypothetical protein